MLSSDADRDNAAVLTLLSRFLREMPRAICLQDIRALSTSCGISPDEAYAALLCAACGLDTTRPQDTALYRRYFLPMVKQLSPGLCLDDAYVRAVGFPEDHAGQIALRRLTYAPGELFVRDDLRALPDGRILPQLGWFAEPVPYPAILSGDEVWMTVTPNEINTILPCVAESRGRVLAYGLGLGYFAFHALLRADVTSVTVVEHDPDVIALFRRSLMPHFPHAERLHIIEADAFEYAAAVAPREAYDTVFTDLWHDAGDGLPLYRRMKALEHPGPRYLYWIEATLQAYMSE